MLTEQLGRSAQGEPRQCRLEPCATPRRLRSPRVAHANGSKQANENESRVTIDTMNFKTKPVTREKEGHYIVIKGSIQQEETITEHIM